MTVKLFFLSNQYPTEDRLVRIYGCVDFRRQPSEAAPD